MKSAVMDLIIYYRSEGIQKIVYTSTGTVNDSSGVENTLLHVEIVAFPLILLFEIAPGGSTCHNDHIAAAQACQLDGHDSFVCCH